MAGFYKNKRSEEGCADDTGIVAKGGCDDGRAFGSNLELLCMDALAQRHEQLFTVSGNAAADDDGIGLEYVDEVGQTAGQIVAVIIEYAVGQCVAGIACITDHLSSQLAAVFLYHGVQAGVGGQLHCLARQTDQTGCRRVGLQTAMTAAVAQML